MVNPSADVQASYAAKPSRACLPLPRDLMVANNRNKTDTNLRLLFLLWMDEYHSAALTGVLQQYHGTAVERGGARQKNCLQYCLRARKAKRFVLSSQCSVGITV